MKKVALIQGGIGSERDVSRVTGKGFAQALTELGYPFEVIEAGTDLAERLSRSRPDVALLALHGKYGEDGTVQGICEYLKIPYSGSGILASAICMDKGYLKNLMRDRGLPTPDYELIDTRRVDVATYRPRLPLPVVVKPSREGSSVGISMVNTEAELRPALQNASQYDYYVLIEKKIAGIEVTIPILKGEPLTSIEIAPKQGFYDYQNKYTAGRTDYFLPARLPESVLSRCNEIAVETFDLARCRSHARIDFMVDGDQSPFVIEVNPLPGCTPTSLFPKSAKHHGISFNQLIETFITTAGLDYEGVR